MGIGDFIYSLTGTVKSYTPDLTTVYGYTSDAISKVDNAVRTNVGPKLSGCRPDTESCARIGKKLGEYLPDDEGREKIGQFAWKFGKNAAVLGVREGAKLVPGGSFVHQTVMQSLPDEKDENLKQKVKAMDTRMDMLEKQLTASGNSHNRAEISTSNIKPNAQNATLCRL